MSGPRAPPPASPPSATSSPAGPAIRRAPAPGRATSCHLDVGRPVRQPRVGHAERRLAAHLAGHSRARVSAWAPAPRCSTSRPWPPRLTVSSPGKRPRTTLTPSSPRLREGKAVPGVRHAGRRPAGSVDAAVLPQPQRKFGHEPAAGSSDSPVVPLAQHMPSSFYPHGGVQPRDHGRRVAGRSRRHRGAAPARPRDQRAPAGRSGRVSAVSRRGGVLYAAADARGMQGYAAGPLGPSGPRRALPSSALPSSALLPYGPRHRGPRRSLRRGQRRLRPPVPRPCRCRLDDAWSCRPGRTSTTCRPRGLVIWTLPAWQNNHPGRV